MSNATKPRPVASWVFPGQPSSVSPGPSAECEALFHAVIDAGADLAELTPELSGCRTLAYSDALPPGLVGAFVPVLGRSVGFHVGLVSDVCSCDSLARVLQRLRAQPTLPLRAALSELAHELTVRFVQRADPALALVPGRPVFVDGLARRLRATKVRTAEVTFGNLRATLALADFDALRDSEWPGRREASSSADEDDPCRL